MADYEIREYQPGDEHSLLETFNEVFSEKNPAYVPRTLEEWRWAFPDNPAGWRIFVALHEKFQRKWRGDCFSRAWHDDHRLFGNFFRQPDKSRGQQTA